MGRSRRGSWSRIAAGVVVLMALTFATVPAAAQEASPTTSPVAESDLDERIAAIPPEELLAVLLETPVQADLFPPQYADVGTEPWVDEGDRDLEGVVGGVLVTSGDTLLGVYIVHPSEDSATARFEETLVEEATPFEVDRPTPPKRVTVAGLPAWLIITDEIDRMSLVTLRVENVIVAGVVSPGFATPVSDQPAATPVSAHETLAATEAVVSHLARVSVDLAP